MREAYEDYVRYRSDNMTNSQLVRALRNHAFEEIRADEVQVGDILLIEDGQTFPADLILISSSNPEGICFI